MPAENAAALVATEPVTAVTATATLGPRGPDLIEQMGLTVLDAGILPARAGPAPPG
jgi:hypothetical protein